MKKPLKLTLFIFSALAWFLLIAGPVQATTITFGDSSNVWPGWEGIADHDDVDVWGIPDITGGTATVSGGLLTQITINFAHWDETAQYDSDDPNNLDYLYKHLRPGDLFIDIGGDLRWNYVFSFWDYSIDLDTGYDYANGPRTGYGEAHGGNFDDGLHGKFYDLNDESVMVYDTDDAGPYFWSNETWWTTEGSENPREDHPVALYSPDFTGTIDSSVKLTGWGGTTIRFENLNIDITGFENNFAIGWTQSCANDVLYEVVPEPTTWLLFGTGLLGLAILGRRMGIKQRPLQ